jgi:hypothetical protein
MEEWKEPAEVLEVARERPAAEKGDAESKWVEDWELKELALKGDRAASVDVAVPGRVPADIGGGSGRGSEGMPAPTLSRESRENIAMSASIRGRMTVSRNLRSVMRRTSSSSPKIGMFLFALGSATSLSEGSAIPQKSAASRADMIGPRPLNSRSSGKNTACMNGRIVLNTTIHMATR